MRAGKERIGLFLLGLGFGLIGSLLLPGWCVRLLAGLFLLVIGCLLLDCC